MTRRRYIAANAPAGADYTSAAAGDILCSDLSTISAANFSGSGKTAIGVVYHNGSRMLRVVSLLSTSWQGLSVMKAFGDYGTNIAALVDKTTEQDAINDLNGKANTQAIIAHFGGIQATQDVIASGFCALYTTAGTSAGDWHQPSAGEGYLIYQAYTAVSAARQVLSLPAIYYTQTSTEYDAEYGWYIFLSDGALYHDMPKTDQFYVLPVLSITY